jgi:predicted cupin superfamily sugar epimerase
MSSARLLIEELRLSPHPEGGWFRETWRAPEEDGERASATAIYFLLEAHQQSHWHKVDAAEVWAWHAGDPLLLLHSVSPKGPVREVRLGPDVIASDRPHFVIGAHEWQAAQPLPGQAGYTLLSCIVSPGFRFSGFTLAPPNWRPAPEPPAASGG